MKKEKITIAGMDVEVQGEDISFSAVYDPVYSLDLIEQFILDAGSDNLGVFGGIYEGGIHCQQIPDEIAPCILTILESGESIKSYLEIGVAAGGSTFLFNHFISDGHEALYTRTSRGNPREALSSPCLAKFFITRV